MFTMDAGETKLIHGRRGEGNRGGRAEGRGESTAGEAIKWAGGAVRADALVHSRHTGILFPFFLFLDEIVPRT